MTIPYKENRIATVGATREVALDPVQFNGVQVTELTNDEWIRFAAYNADGTLLQAFGDAVYQTIYTDRNAGSYAAWSGDVNVGFAVQRIKIVWDIQIGSAHEYVEDFIDVQASPLANSAIQVSASGLVV